MLDVFVVGGRFSGRARSLSLIVAGQEPGENERRMVSYLTVHTTVKPHISIQRSILTNLFKHLYSIIMNSVMTKQQPQYPI